MRSSLVYPAAFASGLLLLVSLVLAAVNDDERVAWLGAALATLPLPGFIARTRLTRVVRTSDNLPLLLLLSFAGAGLTAWQVFVERRAEWPSLVVALAGVLLLLLYVFWSSRFGRYPDPRLSVGGKLPAFAVATALSGDTVGPQDFLGHPAIMIFHRGNMSPFCVGQVLEIAERHAELEKLGIRLALISPQTAEATRQLAQRAGVSAPFFVDRDNAAAAALGIDAGRTVLPTVVVTNPRGTILYSDQTDNYRVRPEPDIYISILKRAGVTKS